MHRALPQLQRPAVVAGQELERLSVAQLVVASLLLCHAGISVMRRWRAVSHWCKFTVNFLGSNNGATYHWLDLLNQAIFLTSQFSSWSLEHASDQLVLQERSHGGESGDWLLTRLARDAHDPGLRDHPLQRIIDSAPPPGSGSSDWSSRNVTWGWSSGCFVYLDARLVWADADGVAEPVIAYCFAEAWRLLNSSGRRPPARSTAGIFGAPNLVSPPARLI